MKPLPTLDLNLAAVLPAPPSAPTPCFFGRRFLTARELLSTGLVRNPVSLRRLIREGRFPAPLLVGRKLRVWDTLELQALVDRLAAARMEGPAVAEAAGRNNFDADADNGRPPGRHYNDNGTTKQEPPP